MSKEIVAVEIAESEWASEATFVGVIFIETEINPPVLILTLPDGEVIKYVRY